MQKINIKFHENGTVSFQHRKILEFVPELSVSSNTKITVPNIPLLVSNIFANHFCCKIVKQIFFSVVNQPIKFVGFDNKKFNINTFNV